ncbi:uncharacterized protein LOC108675758 [Hyalella azteca]|uniref:Uncharacterized protein LOC108675758 n=1 Tax=Hyalella azteca TaxID=294128 RepID=A0A8B7NZT6_HYAAZ|nr:uncharacterized protein LOC108675758 [Hyalella azteca]
MRAPRSSQQQGDEETCERGVGGDEERSDGCFKFAEQVLRGRQLRLPASFQRASSLPRRIARSVTPQPEAEETEVRATARTDFRSESSEAGFKGGKKRAASTSPSRNEFHRSLTTRIPRQLRSFLPARMMARYSLPPRPTRKAGPVGRTWVKVYDDITYMDDTSQEYYPVVGYSGAPMKVPEANPLPRPPTPPPPSSQRATRRLSPTPSQLSEYDNVPRSQDEICVPDAIEMNPDLSPEARRRDADRELIQRELSLKQVANENKEVVSQERPTARKRENTRFKGRRQRRSGTPVATDRTNGFHDEDSQDVANRTFETIEYINGEAKKPSLVEDEYIVPELKQSPPPRPKRATKNYEGVSNSGQKKIQTPDVETVNEGDACVENAGVQEMEPSRPARGIKIYETIEAPSTGFAIQQNGRRDESMIIAHQAENEPNIAETIKTDKESSGISTTQKEAEPLKPTKPKRGVKLYEDVILQTKEVENLVSCSQLLEANAANEGLGPTNAQPSFEGQILENNLCKTQEPTGEISPDNSRSEPEKQKLNNEHSGVLNDISNSIINACEERPRKPKRGIKLYEDVIPKINNVKVVSEFVAIESKKLVSSQDNIPSKPDRGHKVYSSIILRDKYENVENENECVKQSHETTPSYATVQKSKDSQMKDVVDASPPPIPPKKRARRGVSPSAAFHVIPPRPARHLKPRDRSAEAIRRSKRQKTNVNANDSTDTDPNVPPQKPTRGHSNKGISKSGINVEPIIGKVIIESGKVPEMTIISSDSKNYENIDFVDPRVKFKSRQLPPIPGKTTAVSATVLHNAVPRVNPDSPAVEDLPPESETSVVITAYDESYACNDAGNSDLTSAPRVSANESSVRGGCALVRSDSSLDNMLEKDIDLNLTNIESSFATLDTVLQSLKSYTGPPILSRTQYEPNVSDNTVSKTCSANTANESDYSSTTTDNIQTVVKGSNDDNADISSKGDVKIVEASLRFNGQLGVECSDQCGIPVVCIEKEFIAEDSASLSASEKNECAQALANDEKVASAVLVENCATENELLAELVSIPCLSFEDKDRLTDSAALGNESEPLSLSTEIVKSDLKLSIAAESTAGFDEYVAEAMCTGQSDSVCCQISPLREGARRLSVAAESVLVNFTPEATEDLSYLASSTTGTVIDDDDAPRSKNERKLSIAAEIIASDFDETIDVNEAIPRAHIADNIHVSTHDGGNCILSVAAQSVALESNPETIQELGTAENTESESFNCSSQISAPAVATSCEESSLHGSGRKISVAAETVALEFMLESTQIFGGNSLIAETFNATPRDDSCAIAIASVSVTSGSFANTVVNSSNNNISCVQSQSTDEPTEAPRQISGNTPEKTLASSPEAGIGVGVPVLPDATPYYLSKESNEISNLVETNASDSLGGSQASITDDDSVISVVTKDDLAARDRNGSSPSTDPLNNPAISESAPTHVPATDDSNIAEGVADISNRLKGINNFLDSLVRNFSPEKCDIESLLDGDSTQNLDPDTTSFSRDHDSACPSLPVNVSVAPPVPMTNSDDRMESKEPSELSESHNDFTFVDIALVQSPPEPIYPSDLGIPAALVTTAPSPSIIGASAAHEAVAAVPGGTVSLDICSDQTSLTSLMERISRTDADTTTRDLTRRDLANECIFTTECTDSTERIVEAEQTQQTVPSVFSLLDSGLGLQKDVAGDGGSVLLFIDGEWHRL